MRNKDEADVTERLPLDRYPMKPGAGDYGHLVTRAGLSIIPIVGGPVLEVFNFYVSSPMTRRRDEFLIRMNDRLIQVQSAVEGLDPDRLAQNPAFTSALLHAVSIALRSHQEEKLKALVWATLNSALELDLDGTREHMFMGWIDDFTPLHLRLARVLADPRGQLRERGIHIEDGPPAPTLRDALGYLIPELDVELNGFGTLTEQLFRDLKARGLIAWNHEGSNLPAFRISEGPFLSDLGKRFLSFISRPRAGTVEAPADQR